VRVFVTGATGFIGSHVVKELIAAGHKVQGLARSDVGAQALNAVGAEVQQGSLENIESLKTGTTASDAVIHLGMSLDSSNFLKIFETDKVISISSEEAPDYFGWWGRFAGADLLASSAITRKKLGWNPTGPALVTDLQRMDYSQAA